MLYRVGLVQIGLCSGFNWGPLVDGGIGLRISRSLGWILSFQEKNSTRSYELGHMRLTFLIA